MRTSEIFRETRETSIKLWIDLDGTGSSSIDTGVGFMDHMLELFSKHSRFDLSVTCVGDYNVDDHHSVEDIGIVLGKAFAEALGDKRGIWRYGDTTLAMDEALILTSVDISGRAYLNYDVEIPNQKVGTFDTELIEEFLIAFVRNAGLTLHVVKLNGKNTHHIIEGIFKSLARTLRRAVSIDSAFADDIPSTKGMIDDSSVPGKSTPSVEKADYSTPSAEEEEPVIESAPVDPALVEEAIEPEAEPEAVEPEELAEELYEEPVIEEIEPVAEAVEETVEAVIEDEAIGFEDEPDDFLEDDEEETILRELEELERAEEEAFDGEPYEEEEFHYEPAFVLEELVEDPSEPTKGYRFDTSFYDDSDDSDEDSIDKLAESMARSSLESGAYDGGVTESNPYDKYLAERSKGLGLDGESGVDSDSTGLDDDYARGVAKGYTTF